MKAIISFLLLVVASVSFACIPAGDRLKKSEKIALANDLKVQNVECLNTIKNKIGNLASPSVLVYELANRGANTYTVQGRNKQMTMTKLIAGGRMKYNCGDVTPLPKCK